MNQTFKIEIHETWVKTVEVEADNRSAAIAKAEADYLEEFSGAERDGIAYENDSVRRVECKLQWPDGNPKKVGD